MNWFLLLISIGYTLSQQSCIVDGVPGICLVPGLCDSAGKSAIADQTMCGEPMTFCCIPLITKQADFIISGQEVITTNTRIEGELRMTSASAAIGVVVQSERFLHAIVQARTVVLAGGLTVLFGFRPRLNVRVRVPLFGTLSGAPIQGEFVSVQSQFNADDQSLCAKMRLLRENNGALVQLEYIVGESCAQLPDLEEELPWLLIYVAAALLGVLLLLCVLFCCCRVRRRRRKFDSSQMVAGQNGDASFGYIADQNTQRMPGAPSETANLYDSETIAPEFDSAQSIDVRVSQGSAFRCRICHVDYATQVDLQTHQNKRNHH